MKRYGSVIGLKTAKLKEYVKLHARVWPGVKQQIKASHISNYSIYLHKLPGGKYYLFSYFEYTGRNFKADMARMAADPLTQKWWSVCMPCQSPLKDRPKGAWWSGMKEVFHQD
jgi:L-rhamnose mutarotase